MYDRAIVTMAIGPVGEQMLAVSEPLMRLYAERTKAAFLVIRDPYPDLHLWFAKFHLNDVLKEYRRVLFLDADVLVACDAPDIFRDSNFTPCHVGGFREVNMHTIELQALQWETMRFACPDMDCDYGWFRANYLNVGMLYLSYLHRPIFDISMQELAAIWQRQQLWEKEHLAFSSDAGAHGVPYEQSIINWRMGAMGFPTRDLAFDYNILLTICTRSHNRFASAFIHYGGKFKALMASDVPVLSDSERLRLVRNQEIQIL
jgi:hypothetical protein